MYIEFGEILRDFVSIPHYHVVTLPVTIDFRQNKICVFPITRAYKTESVGGYFILL